MWEANIRVISGDTVLLVEGPEKALSMNPREWKQRGVEEFKREVTVWGPQEGFTEMAALFIVCIFLVAGALSRAPFYEYHTIEENE